MVRCPWPRLSDEVGGPSSVVVLVGENQTKAVTDPRAAVIADVLATASLAQEAGAQHLSVSTLLANLHSEDPTIRSDALEQLRSDSAMLHLPVVRSTLFDLLDQNNKDMDQGMREMEEQQRKHPVQSGGNGEDNGDDEDEFLSWLSDTAASVADWSDRRQVCILVDSSAVLDGRTTEKALALTQQEPERHKSEFGS